MTAVAYLCSRYPAVSHTFVMREIAALRRAGVRVESFAVRRWADGDLLGARDRDEAARTRWLVPPPMGVLARVVGRTLLTADGRRGLRAGRRTARELRRPGLRGAVWSAFYLAEAVVLREQLRPLGTRHVHAHFANVAADVALLTAAVGNAADGEGTWSWSFTLHGPSDLLDVTLTRLGEKAQDAAFVACISDYARSQLMALVPPVTWPDLHVVRCGVEDGHLQAEPAERNGTPVLLTIGRLAPVKGQRLLVEAARALRDRGRRFTIRIVGDGPERGVLEREVAAAGLQDEVRLLGALSQEAVMEELRCADAFVLPSFAEGVPVVAMEAMAAGLPVIATNVAGVGELITDGQTGRLVRPGRVDLLEDAIDAVLTDPDRARAMGAAARATVQREFHADHGAAVLRECFAALPAAEDTA